jgi:hypothetical protein
LLQQGDAIALRGIMVLEGQWQGCRGVIEYERFKKTKN